MNRVQKLMISIGASIATGVVILLYSNPFTLMGFIVPTSQQGFFVGGLVLLMTVLSYLRNDPSRGTKREDEGEVEDDSSAIPVPTNEGMEAAIRLTEEQHGQGTYNLVTSEASLAHPEVTSLEALYEIAESWGIELTKYRKGKVRKTGDREWVVARILNAMQTHNDLVTIQSRRLEIVEDMPSQEERLPDGIFRSEMERMFDLVAVEATLGDSEETSLETLFRVAESFDIAITPYRRTMIRKIGDRTLIVGEILAAMQIHNDTVTTDKPEPEVVEDRLTYRIEKLPFNLVTAKASLADPELTSIETLYETAEYFGIRITKYRRRKVDVSGDRGWVVAEILKALKTHNDVLIAEASGERIEEARDSVEKSMEHMQEHMKEASEFGDARKDVEGERTSLEGLAAKILEEDEPPEGLSEETEEPPEFIMIKGKPYRVSEIQETIKAADDGTPLMDLPPEEIKKRLPKQLGDLYLALPEEMQMEIRSIYNLTSETVKVVPLKTLEELESDKYVNARQKRRDYRSKREQPDTDESEDIMDGPPPGERRIGPLVKGGPKTAKKKKLVRKRRQDIKPRPRRRRSETG